MQQAIRPALQRLLARPGSLETLRFLVGGKRGGSGAAFGLKDVEEETSDGGGERREGGLEDVRRFLSMMPKRTEFQSLQSAENAPPSTQFVSATTQAQPVLDNTISIPKLRSLVRDKMAWTKRDISMKELELESNLLDQHPARLLNQEEHSLDSELWILLLDYRQKVYGYEGSKMFWNAIVQRRVRLPTRGKAAKAWSLMLTAAIKTNDMSMLEEITTYSEDFYEPHNRWKNFYFSVMGHLLLKGSLEQALSWHIRLKEKHPIGKSTFGMLCLKVVIESGNMAALREVYLQSQYRNVYAQIVPCLCAQQDFEGALRWHLLLLENNDLPSAQDAVAPLLKHLFVHNRPNYVQVIEGLYTAEVSFASELPSNFAKITPKNSRELVSNVHSKTFHVAEKKYNDNLGARWLATSWITLDTAFKAIHALGVTEIGPLSLHSIVLREPTAEAVLFRINQLKDLGISIGTSHFSLTVSHFAHNNQQEYLTGLLESDQHPHELDDTVLQERLLNQYAHERDWHNFRRTFEILSFRCTIPEVEKRNLMMRISVHRGDILNISPNLQEMLKDNIPIKSGTIHTIIHAILGNRQRGHRSMTYGGTKPPLDRSIAALLQIMQGGSSVPMRYWREIIRRLGQLGHFHALENLCLTLRDYYTSHTPAQIRPHFPTHPLRMLFQNSLQKAIVEWGFMAALDGRSSGLAVTSGISLLKKLETEGVFVDWRCVRSAVRNRLRIYYGSGRSTRRYNIAAKSRLRRKGVGLGEMMELIKQAGCSIREGKSGTGTRRGGKGRWSSKLVKETDDYTAAG